MDEDPFKYKNLEIIWNKWEDEGKENFLKIFQDNNKNCTNETTLLTSNDWLIYELFWQFLYENNINIVQICEICRNLCLKNPSTVPVLLLDVIGTFDPQVTKAEERKKFGTLLVEIEKIVSMELSKERVELETLLEFKIINKNFISKFIKIKTKMYYKQNKFNLFREEMEGYAKLIADLYEYIKLERFEETKSAADLVVSLTGCFNLDPARVLDVLFDLFEENLDACDFFIPLILNHVSDKKLLSEILGFRYISCSQQSEAPLSSMQLLVAELISRDILTLDQVLPWLTPDESTVNKLLEARLKEMSSRNISMDQLKLSATTSEDTSNSVNFFESKLDELLDGNQKVSLCEAFLIRGDWNNFLKFRSMISNDYILESPTVAVALCNLIHYLIEPLYKRCNGLGDKIRRKEPNFKVRKNTPEPAKTWNDLKKEVIPMLCILGASIKYDPILVFKITRLLTAAKNQIHETDPNLLQKTLYYDIISVLNETLYPCLSNMNSGCCVAEAIWEVLRLYPSKIRYCTYTCWKDYTRHHKAAIDVYKGKVDMRSCMKRVSKENVKQVGRIIGKLSHYSPGTLFDYIILQIQMYDNLIGPVVDSLKYLNNLSFDVLGFCIVDSLLYDPKKRPKHDGNSLLSWFQNIATFCAAIYKKYNIDLSGMLNYIVDQLVHNKSVSLLLLKEILQQMAGIEITDHMTLDQIEALGGGDTLIAEAGYFVHHRNTKKPVLRLKDVLIKEELVPPLGILIAQQKNHIVFHESKNEKAHLKFIGKLYDECHDTLLQFGTFMAVSSMDDCFQNYPSLSSLLEEYNLQPDAAFFLYRPVLALKTNSKLVEIIKTKAITEKFGGDVSTAKVEILFEFVTPVAQIIQRLNPTKLWEDMSPDLVALFWALTMYDLQVPVVSYDKEINKAKEQIKLRDSNKDLSKSKLKKEHERLNNLIQKLNEEKEKQEKHVQAIRSKLNLLKDQWFQCRSQRPTKNEIITLFLQTCIIPRCLFSVVDALYCAKFIQILHSLKTENFSTLLCYDRLFCDNIANIVTSCSENEANRFGRFLCAILEEVMKYHTSKELYEKECANTPGFISRFRVSNEYIDPNDKVHYENYRHVCHKWHYKIAKALVCLLESKEYIQIRNATLVLIKLLPQFPILIRLAQIIEKKIAKIKEEEKTTRQDLHALLTSYSGQLSVRIPKMVNEADFHIIDQKAESNSETKGNIQLKKKIVKHPVESVQNSVNKDSAKESTSDLTANQTETLSNKEETLKNKDIKKRKAEEQSNSKIVIIDEDEKKEKKSKLKKNNKTPESEREKKERKAIKKRILEEEEELDETGSGEQKKHKVASVSGVKAASKNSAKFKAMQNGDDADKKNHKAYDRSPTPSSRSSDRSSRGEKSYSGDRKSSKRR